MSKSNDRTDSALPEETFVFPMSFQQEALWFLDQLKPGLAVYNVPICNSVAGNLRISALQLTLNTIIERHEALRTGFKEVDGRVSQIVYGQLEVVLNQNEADSYTTAMDKAKEYTAQGFDLTSKSLFRPYVIKYGPQEYILLFIFHHIIFDGWSAGIFMSELSQIYNQITSGHNPNLEEPQLQYADFAVWQKQWYLEDSTDEHIAFWKTKLGDNPAPLELPTDMVRPPVQNFRGDIKLVDIPKPLADSLKDLAVKESCTLFMTALSAFNVLLYRYSNQEDISVGSPMANRLSPELESSIGYYVNTVVFRSDLSGNPTFRELLQRTRANVLDIFDYQEMPFDKLVEELKPNRELSRNTFFQAMLVLQTASDHTLDLNGMELNPILIGSATSKFDIYLELKENSKGIQGVIEYNNELFYADTIERIVRNFNVLLHSIITNPDQRIGDLEILGTEEKELLIEKINTTDSQYPKEKCIHQLFEQIALQKPEDIAIKFHDYHLKYGELNEKANKLARYLKEYGVGADKLVGIYLDRSIEMVIGLLGILKSGSAYLPLDPMFPHDRLQYMLEDADASILLTQDKLRNSFQGYRGKVICIDTDWESIANCSGEDLKTAINSWNLAYIIYTSGSTGKPKGVQIEHKSVVNYLTSMQNYLCFNQDDKLLSVTTLSFDISVLDIFLPLITGAKLVMVTKEESLDGAFLLKEIEQSEISFMQATPSTWRIMLDSGWEKPLDLSILCTGEAFPKDLAVQLVDKSNTLWNGYGPTEATIHATMKEISKEDTTITIGRPLANTQIYILDKNNQLTPMGAFGELHIGGEGLARGYMNKPELTNERFMNNPFKESNATKIYKTGDLVRILNNGEIECLGRLDHQVKVRGYRIELGEIEVVLSQHPQIKECVVFANGLPMVIVVSSLDISFIVA